MSSRNFPEGDVNGVPNLLASLIKELRHTALNSLVYISFIAAVSGDLSEWPL